MFVHQELRTYNKYIKMSKGITFWKLKGNNLCSTWMTKT